MSLAAMPIFSALVIAAGVGSRIEGSYIPKQYMKIDGKSLLFHTISRTIATYNCKIRVVIKDGHETLYEDAISPLPDSTKKLLLQPTFGGPRRQDSVRLGLRSLRDIKPDFVIIHDACRPFSKTFSVDHLLSYLEDCVGVVPVITPVETVCVVSDELVLKPIERNSIRVVQTPQIYRYDKILECHETVYEKSPEMLFTDDSSIATYCQMRVATMNSDDDNFKITTRQDIARAKLYMSDTECF